MSAYDPFREQKQVALEQSMEAVRSLLTFLSSSLVHLKKDYDEGFVKRLFGDFMQVSLLVRC